MNNEELKTSQSDHDLLIELRTEMRGIKDEIRKLNDGNTERIEDHENRIRSIEKWVWLAIGGLAVIQVVVSIYFNVVRP